MNEICHYIGALEVLLQGSNEASHIMPIRRIAGGLGNCIDGQDRLEADHGHAANEFVTCIPIKPFLLVKITYENQGS